MNDSDSETMMFSYSNSFENSSTHVSVTINLETLQDVMDNFLNFLNAAGFTYVKKVVAVDSKDDETVSK